jgi:CBS domain-containing protein
MNVEELKRQIILKAGLINITPRDCRQISEEIQDSINKKISVTTLKRVFGFAKSAHYPSKYTIATLNDYVDRLVSLSTLGIAHNPHICSFILDQGAFLFELNDEIGLHPQRLVLDAIDTLLKNDKENLPVIINGKCIGIVYVKDLISFLASNDKMYGTLYHKFNFSLQSAIDMLTNYPS